MTRIGRLAAGLDQPLLVTGLVNVRYLTGFVSSNAALLVDPAGDATLYTDFRYAEAARQVEGVTLEETPRSIVASLADRLSGRRIAVEAAHLTLAGADTLRGGGVELVGTAGVVEALRAVKEPGELELMRRAAAISDRVFEELHADGPDVRIELRNRAGDRRQRRRAVTVHGDEEPRPA